FLSSYTLPDIATCRVLRELFVFQSISGRAPLFLCVRRAGRPKPFTSRWNKWAVDTGYTGVSVSPFRDQVSDGSSHKRFSSPRASLELGSTAPRDSRPLASGSPSGLGGRDPRAGRRLHASVLSLGGRRGSLGNPGPERQVPRLEDRKLA